MKLKDINSSMLKNKIIVQRKVVQKNEDGIPIEIWQDILYVRSYIENMSGDEINKAQGTVNKIVKTFIIRFNKITNEENRIVYKGKKYNITTCNNIEEKNKYLELKCEVFK